MYGMDWMGISDHLRMSSRDDEGNLIPGGPIPLSQGIIQYQAPKIKQLQKEGKFKNKVIFSGFEWDMPTYEHVGIGILGDQPGSPKSLKAGNQFEYLFTNQDEKMFDPKDVVIWMSHRIKEPIKHPRMPERHWHGSKKIIGIQVMPY